jgi:putative hydrolase
MRNRRPPFPRFRDLSTRDLQCDLHLHTHRTDGEADVDAILRAASERKLERIAFTEHVRRGSSWFGDFAREVRDKARAFPALEVLVGCETKALDANGAIDASEAILAECDIVLGSVHRIPDGAGFLDTSAFTPEEFARKEWEYAMGLVQSDDVDVLAHPGGMYARRHRSDLPADLMREVVAAGIERGVALEINASYVQDLDGLLALYRELNPRISIGSDMHRLDHLGRCRDLLMARWRAHAGPGAREAASHR